MKQRHGRAAFAGAGELRSSRGANMGYSNRKVHRSQYLLLCGYSNSLWKMAGKTGILGLGAVFVVIFP
jgi:hypothetical protein